MIVPINWNALLKKLYALLFHFGLCSLVLVHFGLCSLYYSALKISKLFFFTSMIRTDSEIVSLVSCTGSHCLRLAVCALRRMLHPEVHL